jgi:hypothetical protein
VAITLSQLKFLNAARAENGTGEYLLGKNIQTKSLIERDMYMRDVAHAIYIKGCLEWRMHQRALVEKRASIRPH